MATDQPRNTTYILALGLLIGLSRWLLPMSDTEGRIVIACGLVLVAIDLTVIEYRIMRKMTGVPIASRVLAVGALTASTLLVSALALPAAFAEPSWLSGCQTPLLDESRFGNYGPDYHIEARHPLTIPPANVETFIYTQDGYDGRSDSYAPEQNAESLRLEFYLAGVLQGASAASPDLPEGVDFAEWTGPLGVVALPNGADEVVIAHPTTYAGMTEANSVSTNGACLIITPYPPPTTTTTTTVPPTTATPTTVPPTTVPPTTAPSTTVTPTTVPPTTITPTTTTASTTTTTTMAPPTTATPTTVPPTTVPPTTTTTELPPALSTTTLPPATFPPATLPPKTAPTTTTTPTKAPTTTTTTTPTTAPPTPTTAPPTTAPSTTVTPTTAPPTTAPPTTAPATTEPPSPGIRTFTTPPVDRIGTPPSTLAYTGSTVVQLSIAAWLFILAGLSVHILFAIEPDKGPNNVEVV